ncbi:MULTISPECIES: DUF2382 domain-containing protein [Chroococcidiopsis]|uniref:PRC-barrel domain protein n=1 Tax=Chroococcidiopsis thermalis (strain PCC 7203) TaxID=251229 RepID=K9TZG8_CHRTP|nr:MULTISPECIES: DUF2382 domain-containing protein [Chroococcidiopsis]AFY87975.1 protein of unknown function DUF2382 [Chroococcidiopsis thermalis PCC 7203]MBE9015290.1 DUF2382 domain-containing protein [Chroococcidiopsidales cyanobacterium LEGE 13417]PSM48058.1 DUF2382 domain-containing protein [Chroococcidiopsis sp. CCALA 051]
MPLLSISDFDTDYQRTFEGNDIKGMDVYGEGDGEKFGTVKDILVDEQGNFRYFVIDVGFWIFGKKVLLPVGRARIDRNAHRVYANGLTREQADRLPEYTEGMTADYDYEERVRGVYRTEASLDASAPLDSASTAAMMGTATPTSYNRDTYTYEHDKDLYDTSTHSDRTIKLYEERLIASKQRRKTGEVAIGKHVETETERVSVPIEKERVVIERITPPDAGRAVAPGEVDFHEGEVARVEVYEEVPDIHKEAFVREEIRVKKVVEQETVEAQETIRREELDIDTDGRPVISDQ